MEHLKGCDQVKDKRAIKRLLQIAYSSGVYDKVIWNKSKNAFIGYSYNYPYSYLYNRDYVYIKGNTIVIFNNIIEE